MAETKMIKFHIVTFDWKNPNLFGPQTYEEILMEEPNGLGRVLHNYIPTTRRFNLEKTFKIAKHVRTLEFESLEAFELWRRLQ